MPQIHLVGLDHFLQNQQDVCWTAAGVESEQQQKRHFETLLRNLIQEQKIELLAEEGTFDDSCSGCRLAREFRLKYINITMPQAERDRLGIANNYQDHEDTKTAAISAFERYMIERVNSDCKAPVILVLCGRLHIDALRSAFEKSGDVVTAYDVAGYEWFRGRPVEADGQVVGYECGQ